MVVEQTFTGGKSGTSIRPFSISSGVFCRGYSMPLERVITDFGSDVPFGEIPKKLKEHYGISVPVSSAQKIVEKHAKAIFEGQVIETEIPDIKGKETLIAEIDGTMIPIVEIVDSDEEGGKKDLRKNREVCWKEARLDLVHPPGSISPIFGAVIGSSDEAGDQLANSAIVAGAGMETRVHGVGDGALWIAEQIERIFGMQANYLIDFYHLCDYLSAAGNVYAPDDKNGWMDKQKRLMKDNRISEVLGELELYLEPKSVPNKDAPVRSCYNYIINRPGQFDYKGALAANLPIGSGEVESAHRYIIQKRLKIAGAWWKIENAQYMLALRVLRANDNWEDYWKNAA